MDQETRQGIVDDVHLKLLAIGYYISAGLTALLSVFSLFYVFIGIMILNQAKSAVKSGAHPPEFIGFLFIGIALAVFFLMIIVAILKFLTGRCIQKRKARMFCFVVAAIGCLHFPYGTMLGIFTFIVLGRNSVKKLFESEKVSRPEQLPG